MVKDFETPKPINSFVRIPGTGTDKSSSPILCDLSTVANISLANPLPRSVMQKKDKEKPEEKSVSSKSVQVKRLQTRNPGKKLITSQLLEERNRLVLENRELNRKLSMFKALFKDRAKLNEVLEKLDEKNNSAPFVQ